MMVVLGAQLGMYTANMFHSWAMYIQYILLGRAFSLCWNFNKNQTFSAKCPHYEILKYNAVNRKGKIKEFLVEV